MSEDDYGYMPPQPTSCPACHHEPDPEPPCNIEAEAALLGAMMIDNRVIDDVTTVLREEDFFEALHGRIFAVAQKIHSEGTVANPVTLKPYFENDALMAQAGGVGYLARLTGSGAALIGARDFALQIRELASLRRMIETMREGIKRTFDTSVEIDPEGILSSVTTDLHMAAERSTKISIRSAASMIGQVVERAESYVEDDGGEALTCRSIDDLNTALENCLTPESYSIVAGRPGMGKSVFSQSAAWGFAANGHPGALISQEMREIDLAMRLAADITFAMGEPLNYGHIRKNKLSGQDLLLLKDARERIEQMPLDLISPGRRTIEDMEGLVMRLANKWDRKGKRLEFFIFDYAQIMKTSRRLEGREKMDYISERILELAKRTGAAAILLSQLSRAVEARTDKRPQMSDLKESGKLEEDAENVILLFREEYYLNQTRPKQSMEKEFAAWEIDWKAASGKVDLIIPKVRHGSPQTIQAKFFGSSQAIRGSQFHPPTLMDEDGILLPRAA